MTVLFDENTTYLASVFGVDATGKRYQHQAIFLQQIPTREDAADMAVDRFSIDCPGFAIRSVVVSGFQDLRHVKVPSVWAPPPPVEEQKAKRKFHIQVRPWSFLLGVYWEPAQKTLHIAPCPFVQIALVF